MESMKAAWRRWVVPLALSLVTFLVFSPALQGQFTNWDDNENFLKNADFRGLGPANLRWIFTNFHMGHYIPLSWLTLSLDYSLWGLQPWGFHLTTLLLHCANAALFFFVARRLLSAAWAGSPEEAAEGFPWALSAAAAFAALFFAVHPLRAESVCWLTERRDPLSGLFALGCVLAYLPSAGRAESRLPWLAVGLFALAVLARESVIMLAPVLIVLDVYPLRRLPADPRAWRSQPSRSILRQKLPFFILAAFGAAMALISDRNVGPIDFIPEGQSLFTRPAMAGYQLAFHLRETLWPARLSPIHPIPAPMNPWAAPFLGSYALVAALALSAWKLRRRFPAFAASAAAYAIFLAPTLGLVETKSLAYERFSYLSCLGWALLAGGLWLKAWLARPRARLIAAAGGIVGVLAALAVRQAAIWRDSDSLWNHAFSLYPESGAIRNCLADSLNHEGRKEEAVMLLQGALPLTMGAITNPRVYDIESNLSAILFEMGLVPQARIHAEAGLRLNPKNAGLLHNMGLILEVGGRFEDAFARQQEAYRLEPRMTDALFEMGRSLSMRHRYDEALPYYYRTLAAEGDSARLENSICFALAKLGREQQAKWHCERAIKLEPDNPQAQLNLRYLSAPKSKRRPLPEPSPVTERPGPGPR